MSPPRSGTCRNRRSAGTSAARGTLWRETGPRAPPAPHQGPAPVIASVPGRPPCGRGDCRDPASQAGQLPARLPPRDRQGTRGAPRRDRHRGPDRGPEGHRQGPACQSPPGPAHPRSSRPERGGNQNREAQRHPPYPPYPLGWTGPHGRRRGARRSSQLRPSEKSPPETMRRGPSAAGCSPAFPLSSFGPATAALLPNRTCAASGPEGLRWAVPRATVAWLVA